MDAYSNGRTGIAMASSLISKLYVTYLPFLFSLFLIAMASNLITSDGRNKRRGKTLTEEELYKEQEQSISSSANQSEKGALPKRKNLVPWRGREIVPITKR